MAVDDVLDKFNSGDFDAESYFGSYSTFFEFLKRRNLFWKLDPIYGPNNDMWQNEYLIYLYENGFLDKFKEYISKLLGDVSFDENGNAILELTNYADELDNLFCDDRRNTISSDTVKDILSGEDDYIYNSYYNYELKETIDELNKENTEKLKKIILNSLNDKKLPTDTKLMEEIAEEQGHSDFWFITDENISKIFKDNESIKHLFDEDELDELKVNLRSLRNIAENHAYQSELYKLVWGALSEYFDMDNKEFVYSPHPTKKNTQIETLKVPIVDFYNFILGYLNDYKDYGNSGTLEYHGYLISLMSEHIDCIAVYPPDYADYRLTVEEMNSMFDDYIY